MKATLISLLVLLTVGMAFSAVRYVNINGGAPYYEVQPAINASSRRGYHYRSSRFGLSTLYCR